MELVQLLLVVPEVALVDLVDQVHHLLEVMVDLVKQV
jgi:hypothetical protein